MEKEKSSPPRTRSMHYDKPYKTPYEKIESNTTYGLSYKKYDCKYDSPKMKPDLGRHEKILKEPSGKFDFDTVYRLSYYANSSGEMRKPFVPKGRLCMNGSHDMTTTNKLSFMNPGYVKTESFKPRQVKFLLTPMESRTITKESYQHFGTPIIKRPRKHEFWQTKLKTDYNTTTHLSYQYVKPLSKRMRLQFRRKILHQMEKDTVYRTSYQVPGRFIIKDMKVCG